MVVNSTKSESWSSSNEETRIVVLPREVDANGHADHVKVHMNGGPVPSKLETDRNETWKLAGCIIYFFVGIFLTTFIETFVHDRLPDAEKYPPLPDIVLDNVTRTEWAGSFAEIVILILGGTMAVVGLLHKHRLIVIRRFLCLTTTLFLIRDVTISVTSLPECGQGIPCSHEASPTVWNRVKTSFLTVVKLGLTSAGGRLCGAYIYSGHAMIMTNLSFFITEYTPKNAKLCVLRAVMWTLAILGMICILLAHSHYTVDVVLGFYVTYSVFTNYHAFASSPALRRRFYWTRVLFPMLFFLESDFSGYLPNEFDWPFKRRNRVIQHT
ncbi:sphingomyelin synthase-related protein 1-like [Glandiceps talaboti]